MTSRRGQPTAPGRYSSETAGQLTDRRGHVIESSRELNDPLGAVADTPRKLIEPKRYRKMRYDFPPQLRRPQQLGPSR